MYDVFTDGLSFTDGTCRNIITMGEHV
jgi:hypothetical protein